MSLIPGNSGTLSLNSPQEIFAPMKDLPSWMIIIHVPLHRPSFGQGLLKGITDAPIWRHNFQEGSNAHSILGRNRAEIC